MEVPMPTDIAHVETNAFKDTNVGIESRPINLSIGQRVRVQAYCGPDHQHERRVGTIVRFLSTHPKGIRGIGSMSGTLRAEVRLDGGGALIVISLHDLVLEGNQVAASSVAGGYHVG